MCSNTLRNASMFFLVFGIVRVGTLALMESLEGSGAWHGERTVQLVFGQAVISPLLYPIAIAVGGLGGTMVSILCAGCLPGGSKVGTALVLWYSPGPLPAFAG